MCHRLASCAALHSHYKWPVHIPRPPWHRSRFTGRGVFVYTAGGSSRDLHDRDGAPWALPFPLTFLIFSLLFPFSLLFSYLFSFPFSSLFSSLLSSCFLVYLSCHLVFSSFFSFFFFLLPFLCSLPFSSFLFSSLVSPLLLPFQNVSICLVQLYSVVSTQRSKVWSVTSLDSFQLFDSSCTLQRRNLHFTSRLSTPHAQSPQRAHRITQKFAFRLTFGRLTRTPQRVHRSTPEFAFHLMFERSTHDLRKGSRSASPVRPGPPKKQQIKSRDASSTDEPTYALVSLPLHLKLYLSKTPAKVILDFT